MKIVHAHLAFYFLRASLVGRMKKRENTLLYAECIAEAKASIAAAKRVFLKAPAFHNPDVCVEAIAELADLGQQASDLAVVIETHRPRPQSVVAWSELPVEVWIHLWTLLDTRTRRRLARVARLFAAIMYERTTHLVIDRGVGVEAFCEAANRLPDCEFMRFSRKLAVVDLAYTRRFSAMWNRLAVFFKTRVDESARRVLFAFTIGPLTRSASGALPLPCGAVYIRGVVGEGTAWRAREFLAIMPQNSVIAVGWDSPIDYMGVPMMGRDRIPNISRGLQNHAASLHFVRWKGGGAAPDILGRPDYPNPDSQTSQRVRAQYPRMLSALPVDDPQKELETIMRAIVWPDAA
jgi:hypothetical protein